MVKEKEAHYTGKDKTSPEMTASVSYFCTSGFSLVRRKSLKQRTKKNLLLFIKALCTQTSTLRAFLTSLGYTEFVCQPVTKVS